MEADAVAGELEDLMPSNVPIAAPAGIPQPVAAAAAPQNEEANQMAALAGMM